MEKFKVLEREINGGVQKIYRFSNDYGASVVRHNYSYGGDRGLWELAVIFFEGESWSITYNTDVTSDVLGYLTNEDVIKTLQEIKDLSN